MHRLIPARAASGDWPTFLHDTQRSAAGSDTTISTGNAAQLALKWSFKTGGPIAASPTVVGGTVYVGSWDGYEYALNATTGALVWKTFLGQTTAPCYPQLAGVSSAADVENGVVYVGGGDSNWYALDAATGAILWSVFVGDNTKGWYNWASPLIYNGYAYIGTASVGDCPLIPGQLLQVSLSTHQVVDSVSFVPTGAGWRGCLDDAEPRQLHQHDFCHDRDAQSRDANVVRGDRRSGCQHTRYQVLLGHPELAANGRFRLWKHTAPVQ